MDADCGTAIIGSPYAWLRLTISLLLSTIAGIGMWSAVVALPAVQADFGIDRASASLPSTFAFTGYAFGGALMGRLGWTKPPAGAEIATTRLSVPEMAQAATVAQTAPDKVAPKALMKMAAEINNLLFTDMEIFLKIPTPPQPPAGLSHKPIPAAPPSRAPNRRTDVTPNQSLADGFRN